MEVDEREIISMEINRGWKRKSWKVVSIKMVNGRMISKKPIMFRAFTPVGHEQCKRKMWKIREEMQAQAESEATGQ